MGREARSAKKNRTTAARGKSNLAELPFAPEEVPRRLLTWYGVHGRDLPWRKTRDPYRIWLSEVMLQQTTVAAVIPYYERFLQRFPRLPDLAAASLDDVIQLWAGLGYYSRARNLHQAARQIVSAFAGRFPNQFDDLMTLPGIGRSTAGAILSLAFDQPVPILDGNVRRVLVRLFAWEENPRSSRAEKQLWSWAERLTPVERPHDYAQAIMDLGATLCTPGTPNCSLCPLDSLCVARQRGLSELLPQKPQKKVVPVRHQAALLISFEKTLRVVQRPPEGLLGGLWEFPVVSVPEDSSAGQAVCSWLDSAGLQQKVEFIGEIRHIYSHFRLTLEVYVVTVTDQDAATHLSGRWCPVDDLPALPLHGAHLKALQLYRQRSSVDD